MEDNRPKTSRLAVWGFVLSVISFIAILLPRAMVAKLNSPAFSLIPDNIYIFVFALAPILILISATICMLLAFNRIKKLNLRGKGYAIASLALVAASIITLIVLAPWGL